MNQMTFKKYNSDRGGTKKSINNFSRQLKNMAKTGEIWLTKIFNTLKQKFPDITGIITTNAKITRVYP